MKLLILLELNYRYIFLKSADVTDSINVISEDFIMAVLILLKYAMMKFLSVCVHILCVGPQ
jgi:hypothetical protein